MFRVFMPIRLHLTRANASRTKLSNECESGELGDDERCFLDLRSEL